MDLCPVLGSSRKTSSKKVHHFKFGDIDSEVETCRHSRFLTASFLLGLGSQDCVGDSSTGAESSASAMVLLEPDKFLVELEKCYTASKAKRKGSIFLTMKRYDGRTKPIPRKATEKSSVASSDPQCLVRATFGNRKISTHVFHKDFNKFQIAFSALMRSGMSNIGKKSAQTLPAVVPETTVSSAVAETKTKSSKPSKSSKSAKRAP